MRISDWSSDAFSSDLQAARWEDTHVGAELVRFTRSNAPAANLWYTKAATDHLVFHQFQEFFSPGYLRRMKRRARNEFDQEFWWEPGDKVPERAPDLERALGAKSCRRKSRPVCARDRKSTRL